MVFRNPIIILPGQPEISANVTTIHRRIYCDGPAVTCQSQRSFIKGIRYHCTKCPNVDFCQFCLENHANEHDISHPVIACTTEAVFVNKHGLSEEEVERRVRDIAQEGAKIHNVRDEDMRNVEINTECRYEHDDQRWVELGFEFEQIHTQPSEEHVVEYIPKGNMRVAKKFHAIGNPERRPIMNFYRPEDLVGDNSAPQQYDYEAQREFYNLLNSRKPVTRIVELLPGGVNDKLECILKTVNLDDSPQYQALSYTWKESSFDWPVDDRWTSAQGQDLRNACDVRVPIYLAGTNDIISIGTGLRDALRCIRNPEKSLFIWADQICINQKDPHERAAQVGYMHDVYSKAQQVILWVGEQDDYTAHVYNCINVIGGDVVSKARGGRLFFPSPAAVKPEPQPTSELWKKVWKFLDRPVFSRGWVIQEITRGHRVIVKCGSFETPWENLACMAHMLGSNLWMGAIKPQHYEDDNKLERPWCIISLDNIRKQFIAQGKQSNLGFILYETRDFQVTDSRDKIYALLGLRQPSFGIQPNYEATYATVCIEATKWILQNEKAFSICTLVANPDWTKPPGFPSWVPPYAVPWSQSYPFHLGAPSMRYKASGASTLSASWPVNARPNILGVSAYHCDTIKCVAQQVPRADNPTHIDIAMNLFYYLELANCLGPSTDLVDIFLRTCLGNAGLNSHEYPTNKRSLVELGTWFALYVQYAGQHPHKLDELEKGSALLVDIPQDLEQDPPNLDLAQKGGSLLVDILQMASREAIEEDIDMSFSVLDDGTVASVQVPAFGWATTVNFHRTMFITVDNYLGIGPSIIQPGDMIHIVAGGPTPYVLRQVDENSDEYELLGDVYIHGLMDGEALERKDMKWTTVLLR